MAAAGGHAVSDGSSGDEVINAELGLRASAVCGGWAVQVDVMILAWFAVLLRRESKCYVAVGLST